MVGPKWTNTIVGQNIWQSTTILKIYMDILLFWNLCLWNSSLPCNSSSKNTSSLKKIAFTFAVLFFMKLELHKKLVAVFLELKFLELEFQKNYKFLIILQTVVDRQIFSLKMVFSHFGHLIVYKCSFSFPFFVVVLNVQAMCKCSIYNIYL